VLSLYKQAGLVKDGLIAIDGTKVHAHASHHSNLDYGRLALGPFRWRSGSWPV
jgi:transposase